MEELFGYNYRVAMLSTFSQHTEFEIDRTIIACIN